MKPPLLPRHHFLSNATRRPPNCAERSCAQAASTSGARAPPRKVLAPSFNGVV